MATIRWTGGAKKVAQVRQQTLTAYDTATTYTVTIGNKTISSVGTGGTVTTTAAALVTLLNASTEPEFAEITWSNSSGTLIGTADTSGKPFTFTISVSGGTGTVGAASNTTANSGPNDVGLAANYDTNAQPANGDDLYIDSTDVSLLYNLDALTAVALASLSVGQNFTGYIGLPKINVDGSTAYPEYRTDYFTIQTSALTIGNGPGNGSGRIKINNGSGTAVTVNVLNTGSAAETGLEAFLWKGTHASNVVNVFKGSVGIAAFPGELATVATLRIGDEGGASDASVRATVGVTLATVNQYAGTVELNSAATTINLLGGDMTFRGAGAVTTITIDNGASLVYNSTGTITTLTVGPASSIVFDDRAKTITNKVSLYSGSTFADDAGILTLSGGFQTVRCRLEDVAIALGVNRSYT